jgi:uncharacterized protein
MRLGDALHFMQGRVFHSRHQPVKNSFKYPVSYFAVPLSKLEQFDRGWFFGFNRKALISLYSKDYGARGKQSNRQWVESFLDKGNIQLDGGEIVLLAMPRCLGYVFNPVCFWLCFDQQEQLKAVITEVNNTFGETHIYLCSKATSETINKQDELEAKKVFHVSPFFSMAGDYRFRFDIDEEKISIAINYYSDQGQCLLSTGLLGSLRTDSNAARMHTLVHAPLVSITSMAQICWQALKLRVKGLPWIAKPPQTTPNYSATGACSNKKVELNT